jgi:hypothetical protein
MLISAAVDILACELGIFNLKIGKNMGFLALGMVPFTVTSYIRGKKNPLISEGLETLYNSSNSNDQQIFSLYSRRGS